MNMNRREMIRRSAFAAAALGTASALSPLFAAPEDRPFKIGAPEWSLGKKDPSVFEVARKIGLDGVQVNMGDLADKMHLRKPDVQQAYIAASKANNMPIASLATGELNNIPLKSDPRAAIWLFDSIAVANALGVKVILVAQFGNGELKGDKPGIDRTVGVLTELAPHAEKAGIILGIENYLDAEENLDIIQRVGSPAIRVYYDVGNSTDKGYDICKEIRMLKGQICEFHAKDGTFMLGQGRIDFKKVRQAMDDINYRGWIQIEAATPHGLIADYSADLKFLKEIF